MQKYKVGLRKKAEKELNNVSKKQKERLLKALIELSKDPHLGKKLIGQFKGYWSLRVGNYRIIYTIIKRGRRVIVLRIADRRESYR